MDLEIIHLKKTMKTLKGKKVYRVTFENDGFPVSKIYRGNVSLEAVKKFVKDAQSANIEGFPQGNFEVRELSEKESAEVEKRVPEYVKEAISRFHASKTIKINRDMEVV
ncbi:MAG: hypothetical protein KatS3mg104_3054 [Phycisphaerae bacterium]|nr:MAG: hypothetical protein KatS3mg104_3054 [Phycisphaerae bacterium]